MSINTMNILLIGSGGREHALAWKLAKSPLCSKLYCAPGNAGIAEVAECIDIDAEDVPALIAFAKENNIDFVVPGPEASLVAGIADACTKENIPCFGPSKAAAELEGSKGFMKDLCKKYNIPTAAYGRFTEIDPAKEFVRQNGAPIVVKTDGLAAGKGVIICQSEDEAFTAIEEMLSGAKFGSAGQEIVIEEFLDGEEISYFAIADGQTLLPFASAQDHKRAFDNDRGPNTGGMGAYSPVPSLSEELEQQIIDQTLQPLVAGMAADGIPFTGVIFAGLMIKDGVPKILEYNIRFGDPECQVLMMRLNYDLADVLYNAAKGTLSDIAANVKWHDASALTVVMAADGYPGSYQKSTEIRHVNMADLPGDIKVFHAGTKMDGAKLVNSGGRVLNVTAIGEDLSTTREKAYDACGKIDWPEGFYRKDIGAKSL